MIKIKVLSLKQNVNKKPSGNTRLAPFANLVELPFFNPIFV